MAKETGELASKRADPVVDMNDTERSLRQAFANHDVVAIVGAGVSIGATNRNPVASWTGLLQSGLKQIVESGASVPREWREWVNAQIQSGDTLELTLAAENIATRLGYPDGSNYQNWLADTVGKLEPFHRDVLEPLKDLRIPLVTTNYDELIEKVAQLPYVTWEESGRLQSVLRSADRAVLHLHGHWHHPSSVVFGVSSYHDLRRSEVVRVAQHTLNFQKMLLFVGYGAGLADPNLGALLRWRREVRGALSYTHCLLATNARAERMQHVCGGGDCRLAMWRHV